MFYWPLESKTNIDDSFSTVQFLIGGLPKLCRLGCPSNAGIIAKNTMEYEVSEDV